MTDTQPSEVLDALIVGAGFRELLYHLSPQAYLEHCQASAAAGYAGFDLS